MSNFFEEVQRRKVYRVAVAYVIAAGGLIQLASAAFPAWELPNWALRLVITLLLIGFPIALIFAWIFDITPEGIQRTSRVEAVRSSHRRRNIAILCIIGVAISGVAGFFVLPRAAAKKVDKSIAVLPFENLSDDKENAYFADGIQDDILTNLSKIGDLKVVSRTSVMGYRGKPSSVRDIGKALGVSAILEGTVRKAGNRVRVNVQLINSDNDEHMWAQEYDRDLVDVFEIQTDLAQKIANELQAKLSPSEKAQLTRKPTENGEAYLAFVQAHDGASHIGSLDKLRQSEQLYERAIQLDPNFATAYAGYSRLESWVFNTFDHSNPRREKARTLALRALQLQPDLPEGHLALGFSYYYGDSNFDAALQEFEIAQRGLPNAAEVYLALAAIQRRFGRFAESTANFEKCVSLNPKDSWTLQNLAYNYQMLHDWDLALATIDRALALTPDSPAVLGLKAKFAIARNGDFSVAEDAVARVKQAPETDDKAFYLCTEEGALRLFQRRYADALKSAEQVNDATLQKTDVLPQKYVTIGLAHLGLGDQAAAREAFTKVKDLVSARLASMPESPDARIALALALAYLGDHDGALRETQRALEILPVTKDAFKGPDVLEAAAQIYVVLNERDRAFAALEELAKKPNGSSPYLIRLNPAYDTIRDDPRFEPVVQKFSAKF
ncbi:MAG: tetratricopeptide repeat protein [Chthoniobacterales bacterium]